jgi:hypothetical protein
VNGKKRNPMEYCESDTKSQFSILGLLHPLPVSKEFGNRIIMMNNLLIS